MKLRGFWNDPDGLSISDLVSLIVALAFAATVAVDLVKLIRGAIKPDDIDLLNVIVWPTLVVLGGGAAAAFLPSVRQPRMPPGGYGGYYGGYGGYGYPQYYPTADQQGGSPSSKQPEDTQPQTGPPPNGGPSI